MFDLPHKLEIQTLLFYVTMNLIFLLQEDTKKEIDHSPNEINPIQALRTLDFYLLWSCMCLAIVPLTMLSTLSKFFGLQHINDDRFLVGVTMGAGACNAVGRVVWGLIGDRLSFKLPLCGLLLLWSVLLITFPQLAQITGVGLRVLYTTWVCLMFCCMSGVFVFIPTASNALFGTKYWAVNFGLIYSAFIFGSIISAVLSSIPQLATGLKYQFYVSGAASTTALQLKLLKNLQAVTWCDWLEDYERYAPQEQHCTDSILI